MSSQGEVDTNEEGEIQVETVRKFEEWRLTLESYIRFHFTISNCSLLRNHRPMAKLPDFYR